MRLTLLVHVLAGALGLLSGYVALAVAKGAPLHRKSGMLFVYVMVTMSMTGLLISAVNGVAPVINIPTALLTFYLVITGMATSARAPGGRGVSTWRRWRWRLRSPPAASPSRWCRSAGAARPRDGLSAGTVRRRGILRWHWRSAHAARRHAKGRTAPDASPLADVFRRVPVVDCVLPRAGSPAGRAADSGAARRRRAGSARGDRVWKWRLRPRHLVRTSTRLTVSEALQ